MAVLSWGKPKISIKKAGTNDWTVLSTPKEGTTSLTTTEGDKKEAKEEGGAVVDVVYNRSSYALEFDLFVKSGDLNPLPIAENDGLISDTYALKLEPENTNCYGLYMRKCNVTSQITYSSEDGILLHYKFDGLVPDESGEPVCEITKTFV